MAYDPPVKIINPSMISDNDAELIQALGEYEPHTKLKAGDLAAIQSLNRQMKLRALSKDGTVPLFWKVRFVVSKWTRDLHNLIHSHPMYIKGMDHAIALMDNMDDLHRPIAYCHGFPHGMYPSTAIWIPEVHLRRINLCEDNPEWPVILDEIQAPYQEFDTDELRAPFILDWAPDYYGNGHAVGRPLSHEEATFHTASLLGLEEAMVKPVHVHDLNTRVIDPEHDAYFRPRKRWR